MKAAVFLGVAGAMLLPGAALAKDARCMTTDDGEYPCEFTSTGANGSFEIKAEGKPTFMVEIESDEAAWVYAIFPGGGDSVALPGPYRRAADDRACWENPDTETRICAY
jgi:hypothetical protein